MTAPVMVRGLPPQRGYITDRLVGYLREALATLEVAGEQRSILVGDAEAPPEGGWTDEGTPGRGQFVPYVTVATGIAAPRDPDPLSLPHSSWILGYRLRSFGGDRGQTDWVADMTREATCGLAGAMITAGPDRWKVTTVRYGQLGAVVPARGRIDPPAWQCIDDVGLWLDRSRLRT